MSTATQTRAQKLEMLQYILEVLELDNEAITYITITLKVNTIEKLIDLQENDYDSIMDEEHISLGDITQIRRFSIWTTLFLQESMQVSLPSTIEGWKENFTFDSFRSLIRDYNTQVLERQATAAVGTQEEDVLATALQRQNPKQDLFDPTLRIKLSDYPQFNGKITSWFNFKEDFTATAEAQGNCCCTNNKALWA